MKKIIDRKYIAFIGIIFLVGLIFGLLFIFLIDSADKIATKNEIINYIYNIQNNKIIKISGLLNSFKINITYIFLISIFSLIFAISFIVLFIIFYKGFSIGFLISSFIYTYKIKGLLYSIIFMFPHEIINIVSIFTFSYFTLKYSYNLFKAFKNKQNLNVRKFYTNFFVITLIYICISFCSSILEIYLNYHLIKLFM